MFILVVWLRGVVSVFCRVCKRMLLYDEEIYGICDDCVADINEKKNFL
jgi:hypothetical protein